MTTIDKDLHACALAALILHEGGIDITGDKLKTILDASNNSDVQLVYCNIVAKFLKGKDIPAMFTLLQMDASVVTGKPDGDWDMLSDAQTDVESIDVCDLSEDDEDAFCNLFD